MSVGIIGKISYGRSSLAEQAIKLEEALDKQIEKKVLNMRPIMDFNGNEIYKRGECPVCGFEFSCSNNINYCFYCGQKLDWSNKNE